MQEPPASWGALWQEAGTRTQNLQESQPALEWEGQMPSPNSVSVGCAQWLSHYVARSHPTLECLEAETDSTDEAEARSRELGSSSGVAETHYLSQHLLPSRKCSHRALDVEAELGPEPGILVTGHGGVPNPGANTHPCLGKSSWKHSRSHCMFTTW